MHFKRMSVVYLRSVRHCAYKPSGHAEEKYYHYEIFIKTMTQLAHPNLKVDAHPSQESQSTQYRINQVLQVIRLLWRSNKWIFKRFLKTWMEGDFLILSGRVFQRFAPVTLILNFLALVLAKITWMSDAVRVSCS